MAVNRSPFGGVGDHGVWKEVGKARRERTPRPPEGVLAGNVHEADSLERLVGDPNDVGRGCRTRCEAYGTRRASTKIMRAAALDRSSPAGPTLSASYFRRKKVSG